MALANDFYWMERLLYFLPAHPQPAYVRFGTSALINRDDAVAG
jgi:hypothetical protein